MTHKETNIQMRKLMPWAMYDLFMTVQMLTSILTTSLSKVEESMKKKNFRARNNTDTETLEKAKKIRKRKKKSIKEEESKIFHTMLHVFLFMCRV